jgi:hypothetical protein
MREWHVSTVQQSCLWRGISNQNVGRGRVTQAMAGSYQLVRAKVAENVMLECFRIQRGTCR